MNCAGLEMLLCDYLDGTLEQALRRELESHMASCAACAELARDAQAAVAFAASLPPLEAPPQLVTRILFHTGPGAERDPEGANAELTGRRWMTGWLRSVLQPRFAMGMAMTILSFSLVGRFAGLPQRQLTMADMDPVKVVAAIDDKLYRIWDRAVKYYENLRLVYEIQSRLREWSLQEEEDRKAPSGGSIAPASEGSRTSEFVEPEQRRESR